MAYTVKKNPDNGKYKLIRRPKPPVKTPSPQEMLQTAVAGKMKEG